MIIMNLQTKAETLNAMTSEKRRRERTESGHWLRG